MIMDNDETKDIWYKAERTWPEPLSRRKVRFSHGVEWRNQVTKEAIHNSLRQAPTLPELAAGTADSLGPSISQAEVEALAGSALLIGSRPGLKDEAIGLGLQSDGENKAYSLTVEREAVPITPDGFYSLAQFAPDRINVAQQIEANTFEDLKAMLVKEIKKYNRSHKQKAIGCAVRLQGEVDHAITRSVPGSEHDALGHYPTLKEVKQKVFDDTGACRVNVAGTYILPDALQGDDIKQDMLHLHLMVHPDDRAKAGTAGGHLLDIMDGFKGSLEIVMVTEAMIIKPEIQNGERKLVERTVPRGAGLSP